MIETSEKGASFACFFKAKRKKMWVQAAAWVPGEISIIKKEHVVQVSK